jgi:glutathione S-transferase
MTAGVSLYMFTGSGPSMTARLMLTHKTIAYRPVHLIVGAHPVSLLARGFPAMTVPALRIDGRRVQGSRNISHALDEIAPERPLFPADPEQRRAVVEAERWGEEFQDAARRIILWSALRDRRAFLSIYRQPDPRLQSVQRVSSPLVVRLASMAHGASDRAARADLAALASRLDQVDAWIATGLLNGVELNAADFQIAPALALLLRVADLRAFIEDRPAARLARRVAPACPGQVDRGVMPDAWLAPLRMAAAGSSDHVVG